MIVNKNIEVDFSGQLTYFGKKYPLRLNGKRFSLSIGSPKWVIDTVMDFNKNRSKWKLTIDSIGPSLNRDGLEKFGQLDDCLNDIIDNGFDVGIRYNASYSSIYVPWEYFKKELSFLDKIKFAILNQYIFNKISPKEYIIKKNKWTKWTCDVCDLSIYSISLYSESNNNTSVIINLYPKDIDFAIRNILKK